MWTSGLTHSERGERGDFAQRAANALAKVLPAREDAKVLVDFVEDDLREGMAALSEVQAHFSELVEALHQRNLTPIELLEVSDDARVVAQLERLSEVASDLRRRLGKAASQLRQR